MKLKKAQLILVIGILIVVPFVCWKRCANTDNSPKQEEYTDSTGKVHAPPWYLGVSDKEVEVQENLSQKNYYIIFDGSGSMSDSKIVDAKKAVKRFVNIIPEGANIGILVFDNLGIFERSPLGAKRENIIMQINKIMPRGRTPLGKSIEISYEKLAEQARKQLGYGEYNLVIITDGIETDGFTMTNVVEKILQDSPVVIHTIGFHIGEGHALNQPGKIYYKTAQNYEQLADGLEEVLAESEDFTVTSF